MLIPIVPTFVRMFEPAFTLDLNTNNTTVGVDQTFVQKFLPSVITKTGSRVRIVARSSDGGQSIISACYIGLSAVSGSAWNFAASPTQVTWDNGQGSRTIAAGETAVSDAVSFSVSGGQALSIALNITSGFQARYATGLGSSFIRYNKGSVSEAANTTKGTGYTAVSGRVDFITQLLVS